MVGFVRGRRVDIVGVAVLERPWRLGVAWGVVAAESDFEGAEGSERF